MIAQLETPKMSPQEYLAWEAEQCTRYGYIDGYIYAMTGGTIPHNQVAVNLVALIKPHLRGRKCKTLSSDAKLGITEQGPFHYPDVSVTCDQRDRTARDYIRYPCLIVEVLSNTTEAFDRGKKFRHYRCLETLREYVLIDPDQMNVECYRLNEHRRWELYHYTSSSESSDDCLVELTSIELAFPINLLYEDIELLG
ncbi:MAG: Uma2 family endonuclease [Merismopedia sp. SIO2A8]|nr:Uma2 family endonuclease [Symploca sp. SIO2B6]NET54165.1 Uma2 family endonuclease [Merismopedia sp. SIO2A8]